MDLAREIARLGRDGGAADPRRWTVSYATPAFSGARARETTGCTRTRGGPNPLTVDPRNPLLPVYVAKAIAAIEEVLDEND